MKLNENSISASIYKYFYFTKNLPNSLCVYFWKLIVAIILFIPYGIIIMPYILLKKKLLLNNGEKFGLFEKIGLSIFIYLVLFLLISIPFFIFGLIIEYNEWGFCEFMYCIGHVVTAVTSTCCLYYLIVHLIGRIIGKRKNKREASKDEKKKSILKEYIISIYNKYCTKIEWVNNENNKK